MNLHWCESFDGWPSHLRIGSEWRQRDEDDEMERDYAKYRAILWAAHRQDWDIERARRESLSFTNWLRKLAGQVPLEPPL